MQEAEDKEEENEGGASNLAISVEETLFYSISIKIKVATELKTE